MKLIVGLGNPGRKYEQTRHNVGFVVAAKVSQMIGAGAVKAKFSGEIAEGQGVVGGGLEKIVVLCPLTYMNASGKSVRKACDFYKISPVDLLVICDDLNLACGRIRLRQHGSAGGQKGLADIIRQLGTEAFPRLRIGIDRPPPNWDVSDYVLGKFSEEESVKIEPAIEKSAQATMDWVAQGIDFSMNRYNVSPKPKNKPNKTTKSQTDKTDSKPDANTEVKPS